MSPCQRYAGRRCEIVSLTPAGRDVRDGPAMRPPDDGFGEDTILRSRNEDTNVIKGFSTRSVRVVAMNPGSISMTGVARVVPAAIGAVIAMFIGSVTIVGCATEPVGDGFFAPPTQKMIFSTPDAVGLPFEHIELAVDSPVPHTLYAWFIPAEGAPGTVLIHHGATINRSALVDSYKLVHDLGWNVFVYDYQGYGESNLQPSLESLIPDADAALRYIQQSSAAGSERIVLFGISLGTLPTSAQAARGPVGVVGVILQGSFVLDLLPPTSFLLAGVVPLPEVVARLPQELDPYGNIGQVAPPKLFLQSPQDLITPIEGARRLFELASEPKQFVEVFGGHTLAHVLDPRYGEHVAGFLNEAHGGAGAEASVHSPEPVPKEE
ncbi:MAG: alpha/beta hydrolase [Planctomycetes bacterium]|nr:alpha/beta hydrolase [Planctomycetota bacterium]